MKRAWLASTSALALLATAAVAQQPLGYAPAPVFQPTTESAEARAALDEALDTWLRFRASSAQALSARAVSLDPDFALAIAVNSQWLPNDDRRAALDRAVVEAASATPLELLIVAAHREANRSNPAAARALRKAAVELAATDPRLGVWVAWWLPPSIRRPILESILESNPGFAPAHAALAWMYVPNVFATVTPEELTKAESAGREALKLEPQEPYTHAILAQVLDRKGQRDEARTHIGHATSSAKHLDLAYQLSAQMDLQDGRIAQSRQTLERWLAAALSDNERRGVRNAIALTYLHEGNLERTLDTYQAIATEADAAGLTAQAGGFYTEMALIAAGANDAVRFDRYADEALRRATPSSSVEWQIIGNAFLDRAAPARTALDRYIEMNAANESLAAEESRQRMRGYVKLAESRPGEALMHFEKAGRNPYTQLGVWEANRKAGNAAAAEAAKQDLLTRKDFSLYSTATPTARYRATKVR